MTDQRLSSAQLHGDVDRLRAQADLSWTRELSQLRHLGLSDGMAILEVGSGPGFITERLLDALPHSSLTCVELDPAMCELARARLSAYAGRLEIVQASILFTDLPEAHFDFALARYVFQHLAAPDLAATEIRRVLKAGGQVAILDIDDALGGVMSPSRPEFVQLAQRVRQVQASAAGDREIGRKLWRLLAQAGYHELALQTIVCHSDELGLQAFGPQYDPERYRAFVRQGGLAAAEWAAYRDAYAWFLAQPDALILQLIMLVSGTKPR